VDFVHAQDSQAVYDKIPEAEVAYATVLTVPMVQRAERLKWVHSSAAAVTGMLALNELGRRGIRVTNSRGIQGIPIAENVIAGLLVLARRLDLTLAAQRERRWIQKELCSVEFPWKLHGKHMTIVGLGSIGSEIAHRASAFGVRVTAVRRKVEGRRPQEVERVFPAEQLHQALAGCDILVIAAPLIAQTEKAIGVAELGLLNRGAILVNIARGQIVDEGALITSLENGQLGGAVLDVFHREPLEPESPLWSMPNVIITPHSSGFRATHWDDLIELFSENLERFRRGEPLLNPVDCDAGY
jgi:phosphoglycerate dehydrogenase-like enzyme